MRTWTRKVPRLCGRRHIAIFDNEPIAFKLSRLMRRSGYSAAGFTNAQAARIGMNRKAPNLLISDIEMPDVSGVEFAIEATEQFPDCKVLLLSGQLDAQAMVEDMKRHGYNFSAVMKPVAPQTLVEIVRRLLSRGPEERQESSSTRIFGLLPAIRQL